MKKLLALVLALVLALSLGACGGGETAQGDGTYELALVTDVGTIDDKSFNQGAWEGLKKYAEENKITHKYYQPAEKTDAAYLETIGLAIEGGAKLVVCPGFLFSVAVFEAQDLYPETTFIILDADPHNADYSESRIEKNVLSVYYAEDQAGFLAGYAAVTDGYSHLGFVGGMAVPAVMRYGYGYVMGADAAAKDLGLTDVTMKFHYTGGFEATPEAQTLASSWYQSGTDVIFGCGGGLYGSIFAAAEEASKPSIGVDSDQSMLSDSVITSASKRLQSSVYDGIKAFYDGSFPGGSMITYDASKDGIGLPMETSKFKVFNQEKYDELFAKLVSGETPRYLDTDYATADLLPTEIVKVELVG